MNASKYVSDSCLTAVRQPSDRGYNLRYSSIEEPKEGIMSSGIASNMQLTHIFV